MKGYDEYAIGSIVNIDGVTCVVKAHRGCDGCFFDIPKGCLRKEGHFLCSDVYRSDNTAIILVKKEMDDAKSKYRLFEDTFGEEPVFAHCRVRFLDNDNGFDTNISLFESENINSANDVDIFYYCGGLNDLLSLMKEGTEDFVVEEVYDYSKEC